MICREIFFETNNHKNKECQSDVLNGVPANSSRNSKHSGNNRFITTGRACKTCSILSAFAIVNRRRRVRRLLSAVKDYPPIKHWCASQPAASQCRLGNVLLKSPRPNMARRSVSIQRMRNLLFCFPIDSPFVDLALSSSVCCYGEKGQYFSASCFLSCFLAPSP